MRVRGGKEKGREERRGVTGGQVGGKKGRRREGKAFAKPRPEEKVESVHFRAPTGLRTVEGFA